MAQYIDKSALVAEIEKLDELNIFLIPTDKYNEDYKCGYDNALEKVQDFIDTLEVKEVDLDFQTFAKEMDSIYALPSSKTKTTEEEPLNWEYAIAKHFFELGMAVGNKAQKGEEV